MNKVRKEIRVRKERFGAIMACGHFVNVGERKVSVNGTRWICFSCHMKRRRK